MASASPASAAFSISDRRRRCRKINSRMHILRDNFGSAGRSASRQRITPSRDAQQLLVCAPTRQNPLDAYQRAFAINGGNNGNKQNSKVRGERALPDIQQRDAAFPRTNDLVVEQV